MVVIKSGKKHNFFCCSCDKFHDDEKTFEIYDANIPSDYLLMCKAGVKELLLKMALALKEARNERERCDSED